MRPYPRQVFKSSRLRHFAAGAGAFAVLTAIFAANGVGIAPKTTSEGIMDLQVDVRDVPCTEPFDEDERVQVIPDTLSGRIGVQVIVRNRQCCCCEGDGYGPLGELRQPGAPSPTTRPTTVTPTLAPTPEVKPFAAEMPRDVVSPLAPRAGAPLPMGGPANVAGVPAPVASQAKLPWWLALAAAPAVLLFGTDGGDVCENDETGANSGPSRTCDADEEFRRAQARQLSHNAS